MARVTVTRKITYRPGVGYKEPPLVLLPGVPNDFPNEYLEDDYIKDLIGKGELSEIAEPKAKQAGKKAAKDKGDSANPPETGDDKSKSPGETGGDEEGKE